MKQNSIFKRCFQLIWRDNPKISLLLLATLLPSAAWSEVGGTFTSALTVNGSSVDVTYTILTESSEGNTCTVQGTYNKTTKKI